jgi:hypothetical protein
MKKSPLLLLLPLLALVGLALTESPFAPTSGDSKQWILFAPSSSSGATVDWDQYHDALTQRFDFHGSYQFFGLLVGTESDVRALQAAYPAAHVRTLALHKPHATLWVVECDPKHGLELPEEILQTIAAARLPLLATHREPSGWVSFVVSGDAAALDSQHHHRVTLVPVPVSRMAALPNPKQAGFLQHHAAERNPVISRLIAGVSADRLRATVEQLSSYHTRLATSATVLEAEKWISSQYAQLGLGVSTYPFLEGYSDNVIAELPGSVDPSKIVILSAHYDSRSTDLKDPNMRAPGADDNGSGTANVLELARLFTKSSLKFKYTIRFCSWSGEEGGLLGSRAYAKEMKEKNVNIIAVLNSDMLGWTLPNTSITLGMKDRYTYVPLLELVNNLTNLYVPELGLGYSPSCCSDHQSFFEQGYPAVGYFENVGSASDYPHYHKSTDLPQYVNFGQVALISQAIAAATATIAEPL